MFNKEYVYMTKITHAQTPIIYVLRVMINN